MSTLPFGPVGPSAFPDAAIWPSELQPPETFTRKVIVAGTNHLLVPARTGEEDEYAVLESRTISPEFGRAIAQWLKDTLAGK